MLKAMDDITKSPQPPTNTVPVTPTEPSTQPAPESPKPTVSYMKPQRGSLGMILKTLLIIVLLGGIGGGVYYWQHQKVQDANKQVTSLTSEVSSLKSQLAQAQTTTTTTTSTTSKTTAAGGSATTSGTSTTSSTTPACHTADLSMIIGHSSGTAGTTYTNLELTNTSTHACNLNGYPKVVLLSATSQQLGQPASQNAAYAPANVTLQANQMAHTTVGFPDPANFGAGVCSAMAAHLQLTPPGETTPLQVASTAQYCPGFSVETVQSGS